MVDYGPPARRCPLCGSSVPELRWPDGRRRRGRPRVFCSPRCRLGGREPAPPPDPARRSQEVARFAAAVRAAVAAHGMPLRDLAAELVDAYPSLASSAATLSAWQSGTSAPPRTVGGRDRVLALERCLGLPTGDLALLLPGGAALPAQRPPTAAAQDGHAARRARLRHLVGALGAPPQQALLVTLAKQARLDALGRPARVRVTAGVRAAHDGLDRLWYLDGDDPRLHPQVGGTTGCRPGRRVPERGRPGPGLVATELVLDRALARGERHDLSFVVWYEPRREGGRVPAGGPGPAFRHVVEHPLESLDLGVSFDPGAAPGVVLACRWRARDGAETSRRELTLPGCRSYELVVANPAPGGYGWRWAPARAEPRVPPRPGTTAA